MAQIRMEKCELKEARDSFRLALEIYKAQPDDRGQPDYRGMMEAAAGLLRLAGEALDESEIKRLEGELETMMSLHPDEVPPMVWYCKAIIHRQRGECMIAQRYLHRYLRTSTLR